MHNTYNDVPVDARDFAFKLQKEQKEQCSYANPSKYGHKKEEGYSST